MSVAQSTLENKYRPLIPRSVLLGELGVIIFSGVLYAISPEIYYLAGVTACSIPYLVGAAVITSGIRKEAKRRAGINPSTNPSQ